MKKKAMPKRVEKKLLGGLLGAGGKMGSGAEDILGTLSPVYGAAKGKGLFGKLGKAGAGFGILGLASALGKEEEDDTDPQGKTTSAQIRAQAKQSAAQKAGGMKKGGSVKKAKGYAKGGMVCRGMGAATRGGGFNIK